MSRLVRKSIGELKAYVPGEQPSDPGIIKLNTNENPYPPSPNVLEILRKFSSGKLRLYPDPVCTELRESIAAYHDCDPEQIIVGNGSDEILALCIRAFVERDSAVSYFDPSYSLYPVLSAIEGVRQIPVSLGAEFEWVDPPKGDSSLFFLTQPNAPTSLIYPKSKVSRFAAAYPGVVVIDEAYVDFADRNCADLALSMDNVIVARSFSKSFSLASIRAGYAVGPLPLIEAMYKIKDSYNVNLITQAAAKAAIEDADYMRGNVKKIRQTRERSAAALTEMGFTVLPSQTNFLWVRPARGEAKILFEQLKDKRILVRYFDAERTRDYLRITVGTDEEMDALLAALGAMMVNG
ncbi:MAG: histidinol-phosphate transaminase [Verrucomicrobia bacterium]|nr:histidinol-phosphate transaminase [Verrucomicrobiota bacterium]